MGRRGGGLAALEVVGRDTGRRDGLEESNGMSVMAASNLSRLI